MNEPSTLFHITLMKYRRLEIHLSVSMFGLAYIGAPERQVLLVGPLEIILQGKAEHG